MAWWDYLIWPITQVVAPLINAARRTIIAWVKGVFVHLVEFINGVTGVIVSWWRGVWISVRAWTINLISTVINAVKASISSLWDALSGIAGTVVDFVNNAIKTAVGTLTTLIDGVRSWAVNAIDNVRSWVTSSFVAIKDFLKDVLDAVRTWWVDTWSSIVSWVNNAIHTVTDIIKDTVSGIIDVLKGIPGTIVDFVTNAIAVMKDILVERIEAATNFFIDSLDVTINIFNTKLGEITKWTLNIIPEVVSGMFEWAKPIIKPIQDAVGFLAQIVKVFTGEYKDTPEYKKQTKDVEDRQQEIKDLVEKLD